MFRRTIRYPVFKSNEFLDKLDSLYITHNSDYRVLVDKNYRLIDSFRYSINRVCAPIIATINSVLAGNNSNLILNRIFKYGKSTVPNYIGLFLDDYHKDILIKTLFKHIRHKVV